MTIDFPTLMVAGSFVSAISGVFLIFAWLQTDRAHGMLWWAAADLVLATAIPIMASPTLTPDEPALVVAITLLNISPALIWAFGPRRQQPAASTSPSSARVRSSG